MRRYLLILLLPLSLAGCFSFHDNPPPERHTTVVVPPGSAVTCTPGPGITC